MFLKKLSKLNLDLDEWLTKWRLVKRTINGVIRNYKSATINQLLKKPLKKRLKNSYNLAMIRVQIRYDRMLSDVRNFEFKKDFKFKRFYLLNKAFKIGIFVYFYSLEFSIPYKI